MDEIDLTISAGKAGAWLEKKGYPFSDVQPLKVSGREYGHGGYYGVEIPVINTLDVLQTTIKVLREEGIYCTRFNETHGSFLLSDSEISEMLALCAEHGYGMVIGLGPRPEYDTKSSFYRSQFGLEQGRRINSLDGIRYAVEEAMRLAELGCRGLTVYDVGVLRLLNEMRADGVLPADMMFKTSTHCMATNPHIARIFQDSGADSVTTAHDLSLPMLHAIRTVCPTLALDVPTDVYKTKGGFIRFYELAEIVQAASPVMLKMGASAQGHPYDAVKETVVLDRVKRVGIGLEYLGKYLPDAAQISTDDPQYCLPVARSSEHAPERAAVVA